MSDHIQWADKDEPSDNAFGVPPKKPAVAWLPATLSFVIALLAFCGAQVYSVLIGSWRWSIAGLIVLFVGLLIGSCFQSYANRRA